jgi:phosphoglycolate phosphatase
LTSDFPRALIFDWDNTLVDSWGAIAQSINHVRGEFGQPQWSLAEIKANCTRAARDSFPEWFGAENWKKAYDIYYDHFDRVRKMASITALAGAEELLRWLKAKEIPAFVVSNKHGKYLRLEAAQLGWSNLFAAIVGAQDAARDKPSREPVDLALSKGGIKAHAGVWFAGDSEVDMLCARNAGCTPVLIGNAETATRLSVARVFSDCQALGLLFYNGSNNK